LGWWLALFTRSFSFMSYCFHKDLPGGFHIGCYTGNNWTNLEFGRTKHKNTPGMARQHAVRVGYIDEEAISINGTKDTEDTFTCRDTGKICFGKVIDLGNGNVHRISAKDEAAREAVLRALGNAANVDGDQSQPIEVDAIAVAA
tara:strand:+ start:528 stop:959 length:432 start_codon:yes stop_codon:yes gene_type:complete